MPAAAPETSVLAVAVLVCCLAFPLLHWLWRMHLKPVASGEKRSFTGSDAARMAIAGTGAPQGFCLLLWPVWPDLLAAVTDVPLLLIPTGFISLMYGVGGVFDWR